MTPQVDAKSQIRPPMCDRRADPCLGRGLCTKHVPNKQAPFAVAPAGAVVTACIADI